MKQPAVLIGHILECVSYIEQFVDGVSYEDFLVSVEKQDAILRRFEIIGEAVKHLPEDLKTKYSEVPWRQVASLRDILIHEYFNVSVDQVWSLIQNDLPDFRDTMLRIEKDL